MTDLFLSYSREDAAQVEQLAKALQAAGYSCWWDRELVSGARYLVETETQLKAAKAVVVIWSRTSIVSHWVADEAGAGRDDNRLAALTFDGSMPPLGFRQFQVTDFAGWRGGTDEPAFQSLLRGLERLVAPRQDGAQTASGGMQPKGQPSRRWIAAAILGTVVMMALSWFALRQTATPVADQSDSPSIASAMTFPRDPELRRAMELTQSINAIHEDVLLAEEIAARVVERSPADPEAVTVMAHVQAVMLLRNFEFTAERTAKARRFCERAVTLSPDNTVALSALAIFLAYRGNDAARAEGLARQATNLAPLDPWPWRVLQDILMHTRSADGVTFAEQNVERFPRDALVRYQLALSYRNVNRNDDFERAIDATIALAPVGNAMDWKVRMAISRGDFVTARSWLDRTPERLRGEERTVTSAFLYALLSGDSDYGLAVLDRFPESWFRNATVYQGPKALLQATLLQLAGRGDLARDRFEAALEQIRRYRVERPNDPSTHGQEALALAGLGRFDEARAAHRVAMQLLQRPVRIPPFSMWIGSPLVRALVVGAREDALQLAREYAEDPDSRRFARQRLDMDPRLAPFRNDRELLAILSEPKTP